MNKFRFALVGCGRISKNHSELLGGGQIQNAELAAVCDFDINKAKTLADIYGVSAYNDMTEMMRNEQIDAVAVLTESGKHALNTIELSAFGKHIIVEKPMALSLKDADAMIDSCTKNKITLFIVKQNRYNPAIVKLREVLDSGRFGKLVLGSVRVRWTREQSYYDQASWRGKWATDGGVIANQASHHIDLLLWLMGPVKSVFAKSATALVDIEAEDTAVVILKFESGALGIIEATTAARPYDMEGSISILGEKGSVEIGGIAVNEIKHWAFTNSADDDIFAMTNYNENPPNVYGFGHKAFYDDVVRVMSSNETYATDVFEGRKSIELITAIYESIETGKEITLPFVPVKSKLGQVK